MFKRYFRQDIYEMEGYTPGFQPDPKEKFLKLNTNESPFMPSQSVIDAIKKELNKDLRLYPDPTSRKLREAIASVYQVDPDMIIVGNGSDELLNIFLRYFTNCHEKVGYYVPSYSLYEVLAKIQKTIVCPISIGEDMGNPPIPDIKDIKLFFLTNPNSPLGFGLSNIFVKKLAEKVGGILVVDEAYGDFAEETSLDLLSQLPNLIVSRTLSKSYGLAGLRVGFAIAHRELIGELYKIKDSYNVNRLSQVGAHAAILDQAYLKKCVNKLKLTRKWFSEELENLGFYVVPSHANFVFTVPPTGKEARVIYEELFKRLILVRFFNDDGLNHGIRISIGTHSEMEKTLKALREIIES
ncbi:MAG: histidinol-phosphate transaminase [Thermodesulfobacteriota bacterium]|nr:histidinol-phosphate transaminase [Thermodesulfobacteriota bacterium]